MAVFGTTPPALQKQKTTKEREDRQEPTEIHSGLYSCKQTNKKEEIAVTISMQ